MEESREDERLLAGAVMGGVGYTIVAPIERAKLLLQTQESNIEVAEEMKAQRGTQSYQPKHQIANASKVRAVESKSKLPLLPLIEARSGQLCHSEEVF
ncbi:hypothetical protein YC2023_008567 [Brassica napus]